MMETPDVRRWVVVFFYIDPPTTLLSSTISQSQVFVFSTTHFDIQSSRFLTTAFEGHTETLDSPQPSHHSFARIFAAIGCMLVFFVSPSRQVPSALSPGVIYEVGGEVASWKAVGGLILRSSQQHFFPFHARGLNHSTPSACYIKSDLFGWIFFVEGCGCLNNPPSHLNSALSLNKEQWWCYRIAAGSPHDENTETWLWCAKPFVRFRCV